MAKGNAISGNITGKKGSSVFYKLSNSNNKVSQGLREYTAEVTNPKTTAQAQQRMKLQPATNFYRGLMEVLDHSFEGQKYGGRNHSYFMRLAIGNGDGINYPFLLKGDTNFVPGSYIVAKGSLGKMKVLGIRKIDATNGYEAQMNIDLNDDGNESFDIWITQSLYANRKVRRGDQITGIFCYRNTAGRYYPVVRRLVLDPSKYSSQRTYDVFTEAGMMISEEAIRPIKQWNESRSQYDPLTLDTMVAAAVILSRPTKNSSGGVTWRRSSSRMYLTPEFQAMFQNQELYQQALASYIQSEPTANSEWYLNQGAIMRGIIDAIPAGAEFRWWDALNVYSGLIVKGATQSTFSTYMLEVPGYIPLTVVGKIESNSTGRPAETATSITAAASDLDQTTLRFTAGSADTLEVTRSTEQPDLPFSRLLLPFMDKDNANRLLNKLGITEPPIAYRGQTLPE